MGGSGALAWHNQPEEKGVDGTRRGLWTSLHFYVGVAAAAHYSAPTLSSSSSCSTFTDLNLFFLSRDGDQGRTNEHTNTLTWWQGEPCVKIRVLQQVVETSLWFDPIHLPGSVSVCVRPIMFYLPFIAKCVDRFVLLCVSIATKAHVPSSCGSISRRDDLNHHRQQINISTLQKTNTVDTELELCLNTRPPLVKKQYLSNEVFNLETPSTCWNVLETGHLNCYLLHCAFVLTLLS